MNDPVPRHRHYLGSCNVTMDMIPMMKVVWMFIEKYISPILERVD